MRLVKVSDPYQILGLIKDDSSKIIDAVKREKGGNMEVKYRNFRERFVARGRSMVFLWCGILITMVAVPGQAEIIRVDENPTRWTLSTKHSTYQVFLIEDNSLAPGYFGPLAGESLFDVPGFGMLDWIGTLHKEIPYRGGFPEMNPALFFETLPRG